MPATVLDGAIGTSVLSAPSVQNIPGQRRNAVLIISGDPTGNLVAPQGTIALRIDGGVGTTVYQKTSGGVMTPDNTGWEALAGAGSTPSFVSVTTDALIMDRANADTRFRRTAANQVTLDNNAGGSADFITTRDLISGRDVSVSGNRFLYWTSGGSIDSPADAEFHFTNKAGTVGIGINVAVDGTISFQNRAFNAFATCILGTMTINGNLNLPGSATPMVQSNTTFTNHAGLSAGTLTNAPAAGNPTSWIAINDNGVTRYIPAW